MGLSHFGVGGVGWGRFWGKLLNNNNKKNKVIKKERYPPTPLPQSIFIYILALIFTDFYLGVGGYPKPTPTYPKINLLKMSLFHLVLISK
jgi:hypothetical protein